MSAYNSCVSLLANYLAGEACKFVFHKSEKKTKSTDLTTPSPVYYELNNFMSVKLSSYLVTAVCITSHTFGGVIDCQKENVVQVQ